MKLFPQLLMQVTLWLSLGLLLVWLARRRGPRAAAETSVWVLGGLAGLTVLAFLPWPAWFPLPEWRDVGEHDEIRVDRISPADAVLLRAGAVGPACERSPASTMAATCPSGQ